MRTTAGIPVARRIGGFVYAIRNIVNEARKVEASGRKVRYLNIGDPITFGFKTPPHLIEAVQRAMSTPPQTTRAKVRGDFIRFARAKNRSYTVDWTYLKLNGYWEETILCMDPFSAVNRRVEELISQVSGGRFYR